MTTTQMTCFRGAKHVKMATGKSWMNCYSMTTMRIGYEVLKPEKWNYLQVDNTARYGRQ